MRALSRDLLVFAYLDAHWGPDLPLREELEIIAAHWKRAVVMVDDFEVPGDSGYGFDDYGDGAALTESYLRRAAALGSWTVRYPVAPSTVETGSRRGCCVLTSPAVEIRTPALSSSGCVQSSDSAPG